MKYIFLTVFFFTQIFKGNCSIIDTIPQSQIRSISEHIRCIENNTDSLEIPVIKDDKSISVEKDVIKWLRSNKILKE